CRQWQSGLIFNETCYCGESPIGRIRKQQRVAPLRPGLYQTESWYEQLGKRPVQHVVEASMFTDYYEILEISPNANSETIERIFRYFAMRYHPDNQDTGDEFRFAEIMEAYSTLKDPIKRARYDIQYKNHSGSRWKLSEEASNTKG